MSNNTAKQILDAEKILDARWEEDPLAPWVQRVAAIPGADAWVTPDEDGWRCNVEIRGIVSTVEAKKIAERMLEAAREGEA